MADIIDKIFNKLEKKSAPMSVRAAILNIHEQTTKKNSLFTLFKIAVPALLVAVLVTGGVYYKYFTVQKIYATFELTAENSDSAGIAPNSVFILKSSKDITAAQVKKSIKISPETEFEVKSVGQNRFEIKPVLELAGDEIYQISIEEGVAERDYSWAFQVRAPFSALSTFPRNQATGVPVNSSIEIAFNRQDLENPNNYFEITPKVDGRLEVRGDTIIFIHANPLEKEKVYTVTVKKGLMAKGVSEPLSKDIIFSFETESKGYYTNQQLSFSQESIYHFPQNQKPALQFYEYNVDFSNASADIYGFVNKEQFIETYYKSRKWDLGWTYYYRQNEAVFDPIGLKKISSFAPKPLKSDYQSFLELPDVLPPGYYLMDVKTGNVRSQAWLIVSDIAYYYSLSDKNGFVWAYEFNKKAPLNDAVVAYYGTDGARHEIGKVDDRGLFEFNLPDALKTSNFWEEDYGKPRFLEISSKDQPSVFALVSAGWWYYGQNRQQNDFWKHISTDRFTYKPTDNLKFWGVVKGKASDIRGQTATVQLRQGWYYGDLYGSNFGQQEKPLAETKAIISQFDTLSGNLDFTGVTPGTYQLVVILNDKVVAETSVEILAYVKPLYRINVTPNKKAVFAGQPVSFDVKAEFYDGTPVGAMKLNYNGYQSGQNFTGQLALDKYGEGRVTLTPAYQNYNYYPTSFYLTFVPTKSEESEIISESSVSVSVFGPRIYLQASQKYNGNDTFTITAKANDIVIDTLSDNRSGNVEYLEFIGKPTGNLKLAAKIEQTEYLQINDGEYYDPINKTTHPRYRYEQKVTVLEEKLGTTLLNGEWTFDLKLPKSNNVYYTVTFSGQDSYGRVLKTVVSPYYYYNEYYNSGGNNGRTSVSLGYDEGQQNYDRTFSVGEDVKLKAEIFPNQQEWNGKTLFYRYGNKGIGKLELVSGNQFKESFGQDYRPGVSYKAVVWGPYGFIESNDLLALYNKEDAELNIEINPDKEQYRPGDTAKVSVQVKDKNGRVPEEGEVNLSVVDEAVFDVSPYYWQQDILSSLYQVDYSQPNSKASDFSPPAYAYTGGAEGGGCFLPGTKVLLPGGKTKFIEDIKVGDIILTKAKENSDNVLAASIVQGISSHIVHDYLVINNNLKVTPEHKLFVNGKWLEAGLIKVGDSLTGSKGENIVVESTQKVIRPNTLVYNFNAGYYHTYFAEGIYAHNAEKGGGYRSEFLDTASFQTKTLSKGSAEFEIKLPDNITSWRTTVSAFDSGNIFAGQKAKLLPASLPFFVDAIVTETYLSKDKPIITARVFGRNNNDNSDTIYQLDIDAINFHESKTTKGGIVEFNLPELTPGDFELRLKANQGSLEDGIIRKFKVVDTYFITKESNTVNLSASLVGLPTGLANYTNVTFVDTGKARFYQELLWNQYQFGKRADQVAASYLASSMLNQHFGENNKIIDLDLGPYHVPGGAVGLFSYGDSDLALSAKLADLIPDKVYATQLAAYFNQTMRNDKADIHRISLSLYGLAALKRPVLSRLQLIASEPDLSLEDKMYISLGLARLGDKEGARKIYMNQVRPDLHFEGGFAYVEKQDNKTKRVKLTALAGALAAAVGEGADVLSVWEYLKEHYPEEDLDVLERMMIIRDEIKHLKQEEASVAYELNGKSEEIKLEKGAPKVISFTKQELSELRFNNITGSVSAIVVNEKYQNPKDLTLNKQLAIERSFIINGREVLQTEEGETVLVRLKYDINPQAIDGSYQIVDYLPSGLRPITNIWQRGLDESYAGCRQKTRPFSVEGNKVYFSVYKASDNPASCLNGVIEYYARAATKGQFNVNPSLIQSLKNYQSLNVGGTQLFKVLSATPVSR